MQHYIDHSMGQMSSPGIQDESGYLSDYTHSPVPGPFHAPPRSHPTPQYNYGDPEDYQMAMEDSFYDDSGYLSQGSYRASPRPMHNSLHKRSFQSLRSHRSSSSPSSQRVSSRRGGSRGRGRPKCKVTPIATYPSDDPMSVITKDYDVPIKDMMEWSRRPLEERKQEVEKKGKIPRPMNRFMMYRTAYKERMKKWGKQGDNNQWISIVASESWKKEPETVVNFYEQCAKTEKANHAIAFPDYKFTPDKSGKKRARNDEDDEGYEDDYSDPDWEPGMSENGTKRGRQIRRAVSRSVTSTPTGRYESPLRHESPSEITPHFAGPNASVNPWGHPLGNAYQYSQPVPMSCQMQMLQAQTPPQTEQGTMRHDMFSPALVGFPTPPMDTPAYPLTLDQASFGIDPTLNAPDLNHMYGSTAPDHNAYVQWTYQQEDHAIEPVLAEPGFAQPLFADPGSLMLTPQEEEPSGWSAEAAGAEFERELQNCESDVGDTITPHCPQQ